MKYIVNHKGYPSVSAEMELDGIDSMDESIVIRDNDGMYRVVDAYEMGWITKHGWHGWHVMIEEEIPRIKAWLERYYQERMTKTRKEAKEALAEHFANAVDQQIMSYLQKSGTTSKGCMLDKIKG